MLQEVTRTILYVFHTRFSFILYILLHFMYLLLKHMTLMPVSLILLCTAFFHQMTVTLVVA